MEEPNLALLMSNMSLTGDALNSTLLTDLRKRPIDWPVWNIDFGLLLLSLLVTILWFTYLTYYNSRVMGFVLSKILRRLVSKNAYIRFGSFSVSVLSGKVMLRDFAFVTEDFSIRIQDGWVLFRFWRPYRTLKPGDACSTQHIEPRIIAQLNGLDIHMYNRVQKFRDLCRLYGLDVFPDEPLKTKKREAAATTGEDRFKWRDLIPMTKVYISSGRIAFGNHLLPSTLVISFENCEGRHTFTPPSNPYDVLVHDVRGSCENFRIALVKSANTRRTFDEPPRIMGEGFVVLQTAKLEFYYYQEEVGMVPLSVDPLPQTLPNPIWGTDFKLGKGTVLSYGPWADKQRDALYKMFFPNDFQKQTKTHTPLPGELRHYSAFDIKCSTLSDATFDVLFTKDNFTNAVHINFLPGSYVELMIPWTVSEDGFATTVSGQLMRVDASTSLQYRSLLECETFEFSCNIRYPRVWNDHQQWDFNFTICRSSMWLVFMHKLFIQTLINEWSDEEPASLYKFVPYTWNFTFMFKEFELILLANEHNWIDTASHNPENVLLALSGETLDANFDLTFQTFLPDLSTIKFYFQGEYLDMLMFLPENYVGRDELDILLKCARCDNAALNSSDARSHLLQRQLSSKYWHNVTREQSGWMKFGTAPKGEVTLTYTYHPNLVLKHTEFSEFASQQVPGMADFCPTQLAPDHIGVEIELGPSVFRLTGLLLRAFLNLKENYFGECQLFSDFDSDSFQQHESVPLYGKVKSEGFDPNQFRPIHVTLTATLHEIQAFCQSHGRLIMPDEIQSQTKPTTSTECCPIIYIEQFAFEMRKEFTETKLQLLLSPTVLCATDWKCRSDGNRNLADGQLLMTSLQLRGHGMFSNAGLPLDAPTAEYAWLLELTIGELNGRLTLVQLLQVAQAADIFLSQLLSNEENLPFPKAFEVCRHMQPPLSCPQRNLAEEPCASEHELKYKMLRVSIDKLELGLVEENSSLNLFVKPVRVAHCTLHSCGNRAGVSVWLPDIQLTQYVLNNAPVNSRFTIGNLNASPERYRKATSRKPVQQWLECGKLKLTEIHLNLSLPLQSFMQYDRVREFLTLHDCRTKRLSFLWSLSSNRAMVNCGCLGNCKFFGDNKNGPEFFKRTDLLLATPFVSSDYENPSFGQSILRQTELVLSSYITAAKHEAFLRMASNQSYLSASDSLTQQSPMDDVFFDCFEQTNSNTTPQSPFKAASANDLRPLGKPSSSSKSTGSTESFVSSSSAVYQEPNIDLYSQLNRPVILSQILMSSYAKTLTTASCQNWNLSHQLPPIVSINEKNPEAQIQYRPCEPPGCTTTVAPKFELIRPGLNEIYLAFDRDKDHLLSAEELKNVSKTEFRNVIRDVETGQTSSQTTGQTGIERLQLDIRTAEMLRVFLSPLGIETLQRYTKSCQVELTRTHPGYLLHKLFNNCSSCGHEGNLLSRPASLGSHRKTTESPPQLDFHLTLPKIDIAVFQCGVVEKIVPFANLDQLDALTPCSVLLTTLNHLSVSALVGALPERPLVFTSTVGSEPSPELPLSFTASLRFAHLYSQLVQVSEKHCSNIGISKNASKVPYTTNWHQLAISQEFVQCLVMEAGIQDVALNLNRNQKRNQKTTVPEIGQLPPAGTAGSSSSRKLSATDKAAQQQQHSQRPSFGKKSDAQKQQKSGVEVSFGNVLLNFGLCLPPETMEAWPLYDIVAPTLTAWIHVLHRLTTDVSAIVTERRLWNEQTIAYLLVEAFEQSHMFHLAVNPVKSKYDRQKPWRQNLKGCPTCLVNLSIQRFCCQNGVLEATCRREFLSKETHPHFNSALHKAIVAALSLWRERFTYDHIIDFQRNSSLVAQLCQQQSDARRSCGVQQKQAADDVVIPMDADILSDASSESSFDAENAVLLPPENSRSFQDMITRLQSYTTQNFDVTQNTLPMDAIAESNASATPTVGMGADSESMSGSGYAYKQKEAEQAACETMDSSVGTLSPRGVGGGQQQPMKMHHVMKEDLYSWLAREQQSERRKRKSQHETEATTAPEINPSDIPLHVYFRSLFSEFSLQAPSNKRTAVFTYFGNHFTASGRFEHVIVSIVEPKILKIAGTTVKKVSHTERPVLTLHDFNVAADFNFKQKVISGSAAPGGAPTTTSENSNKATTATATQSVQESAVKHVSYHSHLSRIDLNCGFSSVIFLNQMVFVARSTRDTFHELRKPFHDNKVALRYSRSLSRISETMSSCTAKPATAFGNNDAIPMDSRTEFAAAMQNKVQMPPQRKKRVRSKSGDRPPGVRLSKSQSFESSNGILLLRPATPSTYQWSDRLIDILASYQRQQRRESRRVLSANATKNELLSNIMEEQILLETMFGVFDISEIRIQAQLTELLVFASISNCQFGHSLKERFGLCSELLFSSEMSVTAAVQRTSLNLSESFAPQVQTVVDVNIGQSQVLLTKLLKKMDGRNSLLLDLGPVTVDIPLHPGFLHGVVIRGTKNISNTLRELKTPQTVEEVVNVKHRNKDQSVGHYSRQFQKTGHVVMVNFSVVLRSLSVTAALLPSLKAYYKMDQAISSGVTGTEARFIVEVPKHRITFDVKGLASEAACVTPTIRLDFPPISAQGAYVNTVGATVDDGYLKIDVQIGLFRHTLTTDLLNQLLFIQEAFMRELSEIIQKITSEKRPHVGFVSSSHGSPLLYSFDLTFKDIEVMATTPTATAVRLVTQSVKFQVTNRVPQGPHPNLSESIYGTADIGLVLELGQLVKDALYEEVQPHFQQFAYFKTHISLRNTPSSGENSHNIMGMDDSESRTYLITLQKPIVFITPSAVDKGILLWLNYKNTYEFWNQQRQQIRPPVSSGGPKRLVEQKSVFEQLGTPTFQSYANVYFQVTVNDGLHICLPLNSNVSLSCRSSDDSTNSVALVVSLGETGISMCSSGAMVSSGRFKNFCVKFYEDFDPHSEDWTILSLEDMEKDLLELNACFVPEGTYQVCSKTSAPSDEHSSAEWILGIQWQMKGIEIHSNTKVGKLMSLLIRTLTSLTQDEVDETLSIPTEKQHVLVKPTVGTSAEDEKQAQQPVAADHEMAAETPLVYEAIGFVDETLPRHMRRAQLEQQMNDQSKAVCSLEEAGASEVAVEQERRKLRTLEELLFREFRRDMIEKLKKQSQRATSLRDRFGLGAPTRTSTAHTSTSTCTSGSGSGSFVVSSKPPLPVVGAGHFARRSDSVVIDALGGGSGRRFSEMMATSPAAKARHQFAHARTKSFEGQFPGIDEEGDEASSLDPERRQSGPTTAAAVLLTSPNIDEYSPTNVEFVQEFSGAATTPDQNRGPLQLVIDVDHQSENGTGSSPREPQPSAPLVPMVDLYLDLKIDIDSGRCRFTTLPKDHHGSGSTDEAAKKAAKVARRQSKMSNRSGKSAHLKSQTTSTKLLPHQSIQECCTVIAIPGISSKVYYASHSGVEGGLNPETLRTGGLSEDIIQHMLSSNKKAQFYMWMALQSMPTETVISPHILDFLEQALEPIPALEQQSSGRQELIMLGECQEKPEQQQQPLASTSETLIDAATVGTASFPVDVVVYFAVKSSVIRFTNLPYSRVECLLKLPSLDLVVTSRKSSDLFLKTPKGQKQPLGPGQVLIVQQSTLRPSISGANLLQPETEQQQQTQAQQQKFDEMLSGGVSVTAALSDFELFIFHPYGTGAALKSSDLVEDAPAEVVRKDALSLQVTSVSINIARSRNLITVEPGDASTTVAGVSNAAALKNSVRFSLLVDISSASFNYDMRRLQEILSFPKAWYRRAIVRRLFLGDESIANVPAAKQSLAKRQASFKQEPWRKPSCAVAASAQKSFRKKSMRRGETFFSLDLDSDVEDNDSVILRKPESTSSTGKTSDVSKGRWEAVVLLAFNFSELNIQTNMGSTMGMTSWVTKAATSQGHMSIDSLDNRNICLSFRLGSSLLDSKSGIVGGNVTLNDLNLCIQLVHGVAKEPKHSIGASLQSGEVRVDYMGAPVFIGCTTMLNANVCDEWKLGSTRPNGASDRSSFVAAVERASVLMNGKLEWGQLSIIISGSTVTDLIKIQLRLRDFFEQEFKSGKQLLLFATLKPSSSSEINEILDPETADASSQHALEAPAFKYHRHWQTALEEITTLLIGLKHWSFPKDGTTLGGSLELVGGEISLACFHGFHFRESKWGLFHLRQPNIVFSTEARDIVHNEQLATLNIQDLTFCLSAAVKNPSAQRTTENCSNMACIAIVDRGNALHPQFNSTSEWFAFMFNAAFKDIYGPNFVHHEIKAKSIGARDHKHTVSKLFVLPALVLRIRTEQIQEQEEPNPSMPRPTVECFFTADFYDHVMVSSDIEALYFLHTLVTNYVQRAKHLDKTHSGPGSSGLSKRVESGGELSSLGVSKKKGRTTHKVRVEDPTEELKKDIREFVIRGWQMEPTVRFLQVANYEPLGIDLILKKLGFTNPWVTIPKWTQRGFMDPLDSLLAVLSETVIQMARKGTM